jgi:hypothetical protein
MPVSTPEYIESAVALGTFALALVTWRMAKATRDLARAGESQLELLRRQADTAEAIHLQGERHLSATTVPTLRFVRTNGDEISGGLHERGRWTVLVRNDGPVPAQISRATLRLAPQVIELTPNNTDPLDPGARLGFWTRSLTDDLLERVLSGEVPLPIAVKYAGPSGRPLQTVEVVIRAKGGGDRWLVIEAEKYSTED